MPRTLLKVFPALLKKNSQFFSNPSNLQGHTFPLYLLKMSVLQKIGRAAECSGYNVTGSPLTSFFKEVRESLSNLEEITLLRESVIFFPQQRHGCPSRSWSYLSSPLHLVRWAAPQTSGRKQDEPPGVSARRSPEVSVGKEH